MPDYTVLNPRGIPVGTHVVRIERQDQPDLLGYEGEVLTLTATQAASLEASAFLAKVT